MVCTARTLNAAGPSRVTLSLLRERLKSSLSATAGGKGFILKPSQLFWLSQPPPELLLRVAGLAGALPRRGALPAAAARPPRGHERARAASCSQPARGHGARPRTAVRQVPAHAAPAHTPVRPPPRAPRGTRHAQERTRKSNCHVPQKTADFGNKESASVGRFRLGRVTSTVPE